MLGGTGEARRLAGALLARGVPVTTSLAGAVARPRLPPGQVRIGGFGGPAGLASWLRDHAVTTLVDATHPFAARISANAAAAAADSGCPLLALRRPGWIEQPGDRWTRVPDAPAAAALLARSPRVFLSTGRGDLPAFADVDAWFLLRAVDPPPPPLPARHALVLGRGPFALADELTLLAEHRIDVLVTRDSGGDDAKLVAARERSLPVILVERPPAPVDVPTVSTVEEALARLPPGPHPREWP